MVSPPELGESAASTAQSLTGRNKAGFIGRKCVALVILRRLMRKTSVPGFSKKCKTGPGRALPCTSFQVEGNVQIASHRKEVGRC